MLQFKLISYNIGGPESLHTGIYEQIIPPKKNNLGNKTISSSRTFEHLKEVSNVQSVCADRVTLQEPQGMFHII